MAVSRVFDPVAEATSAFQLVIKNWMLAVPQLIVGVIVLVLLMVLGLGSLMAAGGIAALMNNGNNPGAGLAALSGLMGTLGIVAVVGAMLGAVAYAATVFAADEAWSGRPVDLGAAMGKGIACILQVIIFGIVMGLACAILAITFVGPVIVAILMMYAIPAIVLGGQSGIGAISESYRLVTKNFGPSLIAILALIVAFIAQYIVSMILGIIPIIGPIVALGVSALIFAYGCAVVVRFYTLLRGGGVVATVPAPPAAT